MSEVGMSKSPDRHSQLERYLESQQPQPQNPRSAAVKRVEYFDYKHFFLICISLIDEE